MKKLISVLLVIVFIGFGTSAFAKDSELDCDCKKGGLGLMMGNFVAGFGVRTFNNKVGCDNNFGIGIGLGGETFGVLIGFGFNEGMIGFGVSFKGPETTTSAGFGLGYDCSDCRMVWPYED
ncbi:MAG: hypothetical protein C4518_19280 [Desulfobacteraceae bacterium]|nr:MAG: hypothetical protein C4518_19280 [Desulfobacteraceae bacterium]